MSTIPAVNPATDENLATYGNYPDAEPSEIVAGHRVGEVSVVVLRGATGSGGVDAIRRSVTIPPGDSLILDLSGYVGRDRSELDQMCAERWGVDPDSFCLVLGNGGGLGSGDRTVLSTLACTFATVGDALQARQLQLAGYGPGWAQVATADIASLS